MIWVLGWICCKFAFIADFGNSNLGMDLSSTNDRKFRSTEGSERLAAFKNLMNPDKMSVKAMPRGTAIEVFRDLNSFNHVEFYGPGKDTTCSCKTYYHLFSMLCVHVLVVSALSDAGFAIRIP